MSRVKSVEHAGTTATRTSHKIQPPHLAGRRNARLYRNGSLFSKKTNVPNTNAPKLEQRGVRLVDPSGKREMEILMSATIQKRLPTRKSKPADSRHKDAALVNGNGHTANKQQLTKPNGNKFTPSFNE